MNRDCAQVNANRVRWSGEMKTIDGVARIPHITGITADPAL